MVPGATDLDFRDVHGVDANTAYLLSAGEGEKSRIYKTADGGQTWTWLKSTDGNPIYGLACPSTTVCYATDIYAHADLSTKENALARTRPPHVRRGRYRPPDRLLAFLQGL